MTNVQMDNRQVNTATDVNSFTVRGVSVDADAIDMYGDDIDRYTVSIFIHRCCPLG